ncbi:MAG: low molecular weight protein-tyrosine phosphatase [Nocardioidaceae bacterium]|nr:low molecular weight protein-tyrosine phosphatase [Nocardioidaceae bacterium]
MSPDTFRVLHVCTGNICRSPMAEHLMREGLRKRLGDDAGRFVIESAGTWGHSGSPMEPFALRTLSSYDVDGASFTARELVAEHVVAADLVLGATREHRAAAVVLHPRAAARTFTLREFARLTGAVDAATLPTGDPVERARALVRAAAANRGLVPVDNPRDDDLDDPYQAPVSAFATCGALVHTTLEGPLELLAPH